MPTAHGGVTQVWTSSEEAQRREELGDEEGRLQGAVVALGVVGCLGAHQGEDTRLGPPGAENLGGFVHDGC